MPKNTPQKTKKRTLVKDLPKTKKTLTKDESRKVKGGKKKSNRGDSFDDIIVSPDGGR